jgi:hypothetical protein
VCHCAARVHVCFLQFAERPTLRWSQLGYLGRRLQAGRSGEALQRAIELVGCACLAGAAAYLILACWLAFEVFHDVQKTDDITRACYAAAKSKSASSTLVMELALRSPGTGVYKHTKCMIPVIQPSLVSRLLRPHPVFSRLASVCYHTLYTVCFQGSCVNITMQNTALYYPRHGRGPSLRLSS